MTRTFLIALFLTACAPEQPTLTSEELTSQQIQRGIHGGILFTFELFGGNGRTCATCHRLELDQHTTLTPAFVQNRFAANPNDPLFRPKDSDDGVGTNYSLFNRDATARIPFVLPPNVQVLQPSDGVNVQHNANGTTTVWVRRSTPTVNNIFFEDEIMWDGREGSNLQQQALDAVNTHADPTRQPTLDEARDIAEFQKDTFFSSIPLLLFAKGASAPTLPPGITESQKRGRTFFVGNGFCATCHGGPMLNTTTVGNPVQAAGMRFSNNLVSETNSGSLGLPPLGHGYPELTYLVTLQHDVIMPPPFSFFIPNIPAGTVVTLSSSDPGRVLATGDPCPTDLPLNCGLNPGGFLSIFKIPTLWGAASTAPYFHDNSAADIHAVMDRYMLLSQITVAGTGNQAFAISPQGRIDIEAFFLYAFK